MSRSNRLRDEGCRVNYTRIRETEMLPADRITELTQRVDEMQIAIDQLWDAANLSERESFCLDWGNQEIIRYTSNIVNFDGKEYVEIAPPVSQKWKERWAVIYVKVDPDYEELKPGKYYMLDSEMKN